MPVALMTLRGYTLIFIDEETEAPGTQIIYQNTSQELNTYFFNEGKKDGAGDKRLIRDSRSSLSDSKAQDFPSS